MSINFLAGTHVQVEKAYGGGDDKSHVLVFSVDGMELPVTRVLPDRQQEASLIFSLYTSHDLQLASQTALGEQLEWPLTLTHSVTTHMHIINQG
jgi:hypothetical protein